MSRTKISEIKCTFSASLKSSNQVSKRIGLEKIYGMPGDRDEKFGDVER